MSGTHKCKPSHELYCSQLYTYVTNLKTRISHTLQLSQDMQFVYSQITTNQLMLHSCTIVHSLHCLCIHLLNQARTGLWLACAWFLKIVSVRTSVCICVCMCVLICVSTPRLLITSGVMWCDMDLIQLVKHVLQLLYGNCSHYC